MILLPIDTFHRSVSCHDLCSASFATASFDDDDDAGVVVVAENDRSLG
jgi:hypothetical protein